MGKVAGARREFRKARWVLALHCGGGLIVEGFTSYAEARSAFSAAVLVARTEGGDGGLDRLELRDFAGVVIDSYPQSVSGLTPVCAAIGEFRGDDHASLA